MSRPGRYSPSSIASVSSASRDETTQGDTGRSRLVGLSTDRRSRMPLTRLRPGWGSSLRVRTAVALLTVAFLAGMPWGAGLHGATQVVAAASATCQASSAPPPATYTVTVCILAPSAGATVTGSRDVTATLNVSGTSPGFQRATFTLDGSALLTDYVSPYTFKLDSRRWGDGTHALALTALMRDGFTSTAATENLTFSNGQASAPPNPRTFVPATPSPAAGAPLVVAATGDEALHVADRAGQVRQRIVQPRPVVVQQSAAERHHRDGD